MKLISLEFHDDTKDDKTKFKVTPFTDKFWPELNDSSMQG